MSENRVIDFMAHRLRASFDVAVVRSVEKDLDRSNRADVLLRKLCKTKRLKKADQESLVGNLGSLIFEFDPANAKAIASAILQVNEWEKRKRYIRFPNEPVGKLGRHAASGGAFARILESLIDEKARRSGVDRNQVKFETVRRALKRTSFLPPAPFQIPEGIDDADAVQFVADLDKVFEKLAEEADVSEYLGLIAKHPIYQDGSWFNWSNSLELNSKYEPNPLYEWDDDDEIQEFIPWWAPKCLIGHLYIPFQCGRVTLPDHSVVKIKKTIEDLSRTESDMFLDIVWPFLKPEWTNQSTVYHRLPLWIVVLPLPNKLVPCLYTAVHLPGGFYPGQKFPYLDGDPVNPCFVDAIGENLSNDAVYIRDHREDEDFSLYIQVSESGISAIGERVEFNAIGQPFKELSNIKCEMYFVSTRDELPEWLQEHPVKRLLKLTMDSDEGKGFALSQRQFWDRGWHGGDGTIFRPAFPDPVGQHIPDIRQNTIAAYLLRNLLVEDDQNFFGELKKDALAKHGAARELLKEKVGKFREAFDLRYDK